MAQAVKLYELGEARTILEQWLQESEGELTPEIEGLLSDLDVQTDAKIERVALFVQELKAAAAAVALERDRLAAREKALTNAADGLKRYLHAQMTMMDKKQVKGVLVTVAVQNSPPTIKGELSQDQLAALFGNDGCDWVRLEPAVYSWDRRRALAAYKEQGPEALPAALVYEQGTHVRIR